MTPEKDTKPTRPRLEDDATDHEELLRKAADALELHPPMLRGQYVAALRLYAAEPWRLDDQR